jgi:hypothetical protein
MKVRVRTGNMNQIVEVDSSAEEWECHAFQAAVERHLRGGFILSPSVATVFCQHPDQGPRAKIHDEDILIPTKRLPLVDTLPAQPSPQEEDHRQWLEQAYAVLRDLFVADAPDTVDIRVAMFKRPGARSVDTLAMTYPGKGLEEPRIVIHPTVVRAGGESALAILLHEMLHLVVPTGTRPHGLAFVKRAKAVGLLPPWTHSAPSPALAEQLRAMSQNLFTI